MRSTVAIALCLMIAALATSLAAQTSAGLDATDPIVKQVAQADPAAVAVLLDRLAAIRRNAPPEGATRGGTITASEKRQIAANPAFASAFERDPMQTLGLLRQIDDFLRRQPGGAAAAK